jgi:hypothetical protein
LLPAYSAMPGQVARVASATLSKLDKSTQNVVRREKPESQASPAKPPEPPPEFRLNPVMKLVRVRAKGGEAIILDNLRFGIH